MKNENQIRTSRDAALNKAASHVVTLQHTLLQILEGRVTAEQEMPHIRAQLAELNQRVHEFNAYHNCLCA